MPVAGVVWPRCGRSCCHCDCSSQGSKEGQVGVTGGLSLSFLGVHGPVPPQSPEEGVRGTHGAGV